MTDYGYDISGSTDITPGLHDIGDGAELMRQVSVRRLLTPLGGLLSAPDEDTIDLRSYVSGAVDISRLYQIRAAISTALLADERISDADIKLEFDRETEVLRVSIAGDGAEGPFELTLSVTDVSFEVITD